MNIIIYIIYIIGMNIIYIIGYKFSWSPLGALKALTNPAVFL
jgi:hypothetical protein